MGGQAVPPLIDVLMFESIVNGVAGSYSADYPHVEFEDCRQELFAHLLLPGVQRAVARSSDPLSNGAFRLWVRGHLYEREMRRQGLIDSEDRYQYSRGVVAAALPVALAYRIGDVAPVWPSGDEEDAGVRSKADPAEGGNLQAIMVDVLAGFDRLGPADQGLLVRHHLAGVSLLTLTAELGVCGPGCEHQGRRPERWQCRAYARVKRSHGRAVDRLIEVLGGPAVVDLDEMGDLI